MRMTIQLPFLTRGTAGRRITTMALLSCAALLYIAVSTSNGGTTSPKVPPLEDAKSDEGEGDSAVSSSGSGSGSGRIIAERELRASVEAQQWPSTSQSPLCETLGYFDSAPSSGGSKHKRRSGGNSSNDGDIRWKMEYLTALSTKILSVTPNPSVSWLGSYEEGMKLALSAARSVGRNRNGASPSVPLSDFDSRMLEYSLATRAHAPLCETYRLLGEAVAAFAAASLRDSPMGGEEGGGGEVVLPRAFVVVEGKPHRVAQSMEEVVILLKEIHTGDDDDDDNDDGSKEEKSDDSIAAWARLLPDEVPMNANTSNKQSSSTALVLYGQLGSVEFATLFQTVLASHTPFVVRHLTPKHTSSPSSPPQTATTLQGYGVRVDIRNVEYTSFDDKAGIDHSTTTDDATNTQHSSSTNPNRAINPLILLPPTSPTTEPILSLFTPSSPSPSSSTLIHIPPEEERADLSLQAHSLISTSTDPLSTLQRLSQNLPSYASDLSSLPISPSLRADAEGIWRLNSFGDLVMAGAGGAGGAGRVSVEGVAEFYVGGRRVAIDRPSFNLFELIGVLREEERMFKVVEERIGRYLPDDGGDGKGDVKGDVKAGSGSKTLTSITTSLLAMGKESFDSLSLQTNNDDTTNETPPPPSSDQIRIDVGRGYRGAVLYLNDLERDREYKSYPTQVQAMLFAMQYGQPPSVRRNMLTVTMVVDPLRIAGDGVGGGNPDAYLESLGLLAQMMQGGFPVRLGVLFASGRDVESCRVQLSRRSAAVVEEGGLLVSECKVPPAIPHDELATTHATFKLFQHVLQSHGGMIALHYLYLTADRLNSLRTSSNNNDDDDDDDDEEKKKKQPSPPKPIHLTDLIQIHGEVMLTIQRGTGDKPTEQQVRNIISSPDGTKSNSDTYGKSVKFVTEHNIRPGMGFVNGIYLPMASSPEECNDVVQGELRHIMSLVMQGVITDSAPRSVYAMLLKGRTVYKALHPLLLTDESRTDNDGEDDDDDGDDDNGDDDDYDNNGKRSKYRLLEDHHTSPPNDTLPPQPIVQLKKPSSPNSPSILYEAIADFTSPTGLQAIDAFLTAIHTYASSKQSNTDDTEENDMGISYRIVPANLGSARDVLNGLLGATARHAGRMHPSLVRSVFSSAIGGSRLFDGVEDADGQREVVKSVMEADACGKMGKEVEMEDAQRWCPFEAVGVDDTFYEDDEGDGTFVLLGNGRVLVPEAPVNVDDIEILAALEGAAARIISDRLFTNPTTGISSHLKDSGDRALVVARVAAFLGEEFDAAKSKKSSGVVRADVGAIVKDVRKVGVDDGHPFCYTWNQPGENEDENDNVNGPQHGGIHVTAILDPLTAATQRVAPILRTIRDDLSLPLSLIILPRTKITEGSQIPITSYYRFVDGGKSGRDATESAQQAVFRGLPTNQVLTLRMDVPEPWDVQQSYAVQDTDNLRCDSSSCGDYDYALALSKHSGGQTPHAKTESEEERDLTVVQYQLNNLLFFGRCHDLTTGSPPNGLQLTLSDKINSKSHSSHQPPPPSSSSAAANIEINPDGSISNPSASNTSQDQTPPVTTDTLVMKTVGYWQLRSNPGVWQLQIAKSSRGAEIFDMIEPGNALTTTTSSKTIVMKDFVDRGKSLLVRRKPGFEHADLFYDTNTPQQQQEEDDTVHVFSLATGHLYERFLKIMMLSVTKRTSVNVKFWLFENFLSPSFKASAYAMAERIGCQLEFVTYKWPQWLRAQSEKQRIIWGYKILFLDTLFPLHLKKIIYVDADQVVRGDLKELWDLDLNGAPYGYTPFCTSREETLGYQFWRDGFWTNHLRGKPYHISALYVVDLERFRRELVGDKLRSLYQQLSSDPNNLSNLDQDLPNYAQYMVPIHSLPQDWLWCETWCSDETKATAKTIDLCNNPEHKEPKVSMAKRIISGDLFEESWIDLDAEVDLYEKEYLSLV